VTNTIPRIALPAQRLFQGSLVLIFIRKTVCKLNGETVDYAQLWKNVVGVGFFLTGVLIFASTYVGTSLKGFSDVEVTLIADTVANALFVPYSWFVGRQNRPHTDLA
jgi:hypothetical protein